jgi:hypothetical protein
MTWSTLFRYLKAPQSVLAAALMFSALFIMVGWDFRTPGSMVGDYKAEHALVHISLDTTLASLTQTAKLTEGLVRLACLRETSDNLALAGLATTCKEYGMPSIKLSGYVAAGSK